jgi:hypothetical protein
MKTWKVIELSGDTHEVTASNVETTDCGATFYTTDGEGTVMQAHFAEVRSIEEVRERTAEEWKMLCKYHEATLQGTIDGMRRQRADHEKRITDLFAEARRQDSTGPAGPTGATKYDSMSKDELIREIEVWRSSACSRSEALQDAKGTLRAVCWDVEDANKANIAWAVALGVMLVVSTVLAGIVWGLPELAPIATGCSVSALTMFVCTLFAMRPLDRVIAKCQRASEEMSTKKGI